MSEKKYRPTGKPLRALQALKDTTADTAMTGLEVWWSGDYRWAGPEWREDLVTLVRHGLATRIEGRPARWHITDTGAALLAEQEGR